MDLKQTSIDSLGSLSQYSHTIITDHGLNFKAVRHIIFMIRENSQSIVPTEF